MARLNCQVLFKPGRVTIVWSEGTQTFEPYHLEGEEARRLDDVARTARHRLTQAIHASDDQVALRDLAGLGHQLYRLLFHVDANDPAARTVQEWWQHRSGTVTSFDILTNNPGRVPWNLVHDGGREGGLEAFWGSRFPLGVGRRVSPLLAMPTLVDPTSLLLVDTREDSSRELVTWANDRQLPVSNSTGAFIDALDERAADVLVLSGRAEEGRLHWHDQNVALDEVYETVNHPDRGNPLALYVLNVHGEASQVDHWECLVGSIATNVAGAVLPEVPFPAKQSAQLVGAFLRGFLGGNVELGEALRQARREAGLGGLAWSALAPAGLGANLSGDDPYLRAKSSPLPDQPYSPLQALDRGRRVFLAARQRDVLNLVQRLDEPGTRGILVHGGPASGKTSFLQAGVLPYLEEEAIGFRGLRVRTGEESDDTLLMRTGPDILGQMCQALAYFAATPLDYSTPKGNSVRLDLPAYVSRIKADNATSTALRAGAPIASAITSGPLGSTENPGDSSTNPDDWAVELYRLGTETPDVWLRVVDELTRSLPGELVLIFEQAEDLLKVENETGRDRRRQGLELLTRLASSAARCRIVISLRTDALGEFLSLLPGGKDRGTWREFFLPPLGREALEEVFLLPTATEPLPYGEGSPHAKYGFYIEESLAPHLVREVLRISQEAQFSPLPLLHVIAASLHQHQLGRGGDATLRQTDLRRMEPLQDLPAKMVDRLLLTQGLGHRDVQELLDRLVRFQPGGGVGRELVSIRNLAAITPGTSVGLESKIEQLSQTSPPILDVQTFLPGGQPEFYVSLANDSVAQTRARNRDLKATRTYARTKVIDTLWIMIPLAALAAAISFFLTRRYDNSMIAERIKAEEDKLTAQVTKFLQQKETEHGMELDQYRDLMNWSMYRSNISDATRALDLGDLVKARGYLISTMPMPADKKGDSMRRDLRGFEWFYLWRQLHPERYILQGHAAPVSSIVLSPDEKWIASSALDGTIKLWDRENLREIDSIPPGKAPVHSIAFTTDGTKLVAARADKKVFVYDIKVGKEETRFSERPAEHSKGLDAEVVALASAKGRSVAAIDAKGNLLLFNEKGEPATHTLDQPVRVAAYGQNDLLIVAGKGGKLNGVNPAKGKDTGLSMDTPLARIDALSWNGDLGLLAVGGSKQADGSGRGEVVILDKAGKIVGSPLELATGVRALAWVKGQNTLAIGTHQHAMHLWDREKGGGLRTLQSHLGWINAIASGPDGLVLSGGADAHIKVWALRPDFQPDSLTPLDAPVRVLAFTPDNRSIISGDAEGAIRLTDVKTGKVLAKLEKNGMEAQAILFFQEKEQTKVVLAWAGAKDEGVVALADYQRDEKGAELKNQKAIAGLSGAPLSLAIASDGKSAFVGTRAGKLIHLPLDKQKATEFEATKEGITSVALAAEEQVVVAGTASGEVVVYDISTGKKMASAKSHAGAVRNILEIPRKVKDESRFFTWADDGMFIAWNWKGTSVKAIFSQHRSGTAAPSTIARSPKTSIFLFGYNDQGVQLLDDEFRQRFVLTGLSSPVRMVAVAPDESMIAAGSDNGVVRLWRAITPAELKNPQPR